jgi:hypothetical protein
MAETLTVRVIEREILAHDAIAKMQIDMRPGAKRGQGSAVRRGQRQDYHLRLARRFAGGACFTARRRGAN